MIYFSAWRMLAEKSKHLPWVWKFPSSFYKFLQVLPSAAVVFYKQSLRRFLVNKAQGQLVLILESMTDVD